MNLRTQHFHRYRTTIAFAFRFFCAAVLAIAYQGLPSAFFGEGNSGPLVILACGKFFLMIFYVYSNAPIFTGYICDARAEVMNSHNETWTGNPFSYSQMSIWFPTHLSSTQGRVTWYCSISTQKSGDSERRGTLASLNHSTIKIE